MKTLDKSLLFSLTCSLLITFWGQLVLSLPSHHTDGADRLTGTRSEWEAKLETARQGFLVAPGDVTARRAYAEALFKLGDIWEASGVIKPLATIDSKHETDLLLGARTALLTMDLRRAERLYGRLAAIAEQGSERAVAALRGLVMVYYHSGQFGKARELEFPVDSGEQSGSSLVQFMTAFEGNPYVSRWVSDEKVAHLPFTNDITQPGSLPEVRVTVNGESVLLTLDTGGDRLYLDVSVAEKSGIRCLLMSQARYAYTRGELVDEPWGVADRVELGGVILENVPTVVAQWKANGPTTDGVIGTAILKQFLSTIDYERGEITLRPRGESGATSQAKVVAGRDLVRIPFYLASTHLMFAKGSINSYENLNFFLDSGLAATMPLIILDETRELLDLPRNEIEGTPYYWSPIESHGLNGLLAGASQALGNVLIEGNNYRSQGFFWDALISHQYLWRLGSWTIDFDTMSYIFPAETEMSVGPNAASELPGPP